MCQRVIKGIFSTKELKEQERKNKAIDRMLLYERNSPVTIIKLLLLGPGECGKSTILKQIRIIHDKGFTNAEIENRKFVIYSNMLESMFAILNAMDKLEILLDKPKLEKEARHILELYEKYRPSEDQLSDKTFRAIQKLWTDAGVQECFLRRSEYQVTDSCQYFFDSLDRIKRSKYKPTVQDILYTRVPTTGIAQVEFALPGQIVFRVYDVGGQRSERRKWIHYFDDVNAIIFMIAISEYDQTMREDEKTNRMTDGLTLWNEICNGTWFANTSVVVFLNKTDLFREKITRTSIRVCFPDYAGAQTYDESVGFIKKLFEKKNEQPREIHIHETCATNTDQVELVLHSVTDFIIRANSERTGFL